MLEPPLEGSPSARKFAVQVLSSLNELSKKSRKSKNELGKSLEGSLSPLSELAQAGERIVMVRMRSMRQNTAILAFSGVQIRCLLAPSIMP